ncbi:MAG: c-type cytochrome [Anaerolineales bacterium]
MNEEIRQRYKEKYTLAKQKGVKFFPDIIYKDLLVAFGLFVLLIGLAVFVGVPNEPKADPNDTSYIPRPEWYFLFLFQLLKYFPGQIEWVGTAVIPGLAVLTLFLLPFIDRNPHRHWSRRKVALSIMGTIVTGMVVLTILAAVTTPPQAEVVAATTISEKMALGEELYGLHCVECHGADGEGGEITSVAGLEGVVLKPINDQDVMYPFSDDTLYNIIAMGQPVQGMPPFGRAYGGELSPTEIEAIVTFMRYSWDDRAELPEEATVAAAMPTLKEDEVPSYDVHVAPIFKRYCVSCHVPGKKNNNYLMRTYEEVMQSGDHAPNVIPGDLGSNLIRMVHREEIEAGGPMPPTKALKPELVEILDRWVLGGAPQTAEQAAQASAGSGQAPAVEASTETPQSESAPTALPPTPTATPASSSSTDGALQAIQTLLPILGLPDLPLEYAGEDQMVNAPDGALRVQIYIDPEGRHYAYDPMSRQVVEVDGRETLSSLPATATPLASAELRAKAEAIANAVLPNFTQRASSLTYEEGNKGTFYFFAWRDSAPSTFNKPFLQVAFTQSGAVFAFYNTLILPLPE